MTTPTQAADIVFTRHPAIRGLAWLREAWAMFGRQRMPWLVLITLYYLIMIVATSLPIVGQVLWPFAKPVFAVGLLAAAWTQERGGRPVPSDLFRGFRSNLAALLPFGLVVMAGVIAAVTLASAIDGGLLMQLLTDPEAKADEILREPRLQMGLLAGVLVGLPVTLALWFAPALVVFQDTGPRAALGASLRASLANWKPIAVYGLAVFVLGGVLPILAGQLLLTLFPNEAGVAAVRVLVIAWWLMFAAMLHISDYVSYRDIFHANETLAPLNAGRTDPPG